MLQGCLSQQGHAHAYQTYSHGQKFGSLRHFSEKIEVCPCSQDLHYLDGLTLEGVAAKYGDSLATAHTLHGIRML